MGEARRRKEAMKPNIERLIREERDLKLLVRVAKRLGCGDNEAIGPVLERDPERTQAVLTEERALEQAEALRATAARGTAD